MGEKHFIPIRKEKKRFADSRINTRIIFWKEILLILAVVFCVMLAVALIVFYLANNTLTLIGIIASFVAVISALACILWALIKRMSYMRVYQAFTKAAREIAKGDYSIRLEKYRKDGKMDEIEVLIEDFNKMVERLESTEMLQKDFAANVSHEIKTPLAQIQSYSQLLKDPDLTEAERLQCTDTIIQATKRLNVMTSNILRLNKLENNQENVVNIEPYQLGEQVRTGVLNYMEQMEKKGLELYVDIADVVVYADAELLDLAWSNLLSNAIKFSKAGDQISVISEVEGDTVVIRISDTGIGMDEKTKERVFEKFYQGDTSHSKEGNGLGMPLTKKVIEISGGTIEVESELGKGTTFIVHLPVHTEIAA